jgi:outer membrane protein OmpA-like peptidoglycan-associated protein
MANARLSIVVLTWGGLVLGSVGTAVTPSNAQTTRNTLDAIDRTVTASEIADALRPRVLRNLGPAAPKENSAMVALTFETGSAVLTDRSKTALVEFGKAFKDFLPDVVVVIEGHADPRGTPEYNLALSERRAAAVRDFLVAQLGNDPKQFEVVGLGQTRLMDPEHPSAKVNRRVEFVTKNNP